MCCNTQAFDHTLLTKGRQYEGQEYPKEFILGKYDAAGAVCFVLDLMVSDNECWTVCVRIWQTYMALQDFQLILAYAYSACQLVIIFVMCPPPRINDSGLCV